ncbi:MAG TPA: hypothetical protein VJN92_21180 [Candidatus Acidoferrum sp.]|nr:hypothetical protein [Candidatus Acidoferrum sp.]
MTLTEALQIKEHYLQPQDLRAMAYCEKRWQEEGRPLTRWGVVNFIERMLRELQHNGIGYPKVLLLRKKEIVGRRFTIREPGEEQDSDGRCPCVGGYFANGTICPCPKGEPHREQFRKLGMNV